MIPLGFLELLLSVFGAVWRNCDSIFGGALYFTGTEVERRRLKRNTRSKAYGDYQ
jgi:hypothetical protein